MLLREAMSQEEDVKTIYTPRLAWSHTITYIISTHDTQLHTRTSRTLINTPPSFKMEAFERVAEDERKR